MLESIDCMHWEWKNCPKALHGQFKRRDHKYPTLMLEAVADQKLWTWHAYFGVSKANNDLNVLYGSSLFDDVLADTASKAPFVVNGRTYKKGYYLADGIYQTWFTFVKTFTIARDEKTLRFKRVQESARKDIERAFGVLQGRWGIIRQPARALQINTLKRIIMLESIDCMHWEWKNCPKALHGQFKRRDHKYPTLMLEAVADQKLWTWHAYFGVSKANNDLNVLYGSSLFDDVLADTASKAPFVVNGRTYKKGYYLADGIYQTWFTFVKTFTIARDEKTLRFKRVQESARKDIERAFGVLQGRWGIIRQPARALQINTLKRIMYCCIILHNMILQSKKFELSNFKDMFVNPDSNIQRT
nr:hypothetical protein [Tanacetum cinerariifolium]